MYLAAMQDMPLKQNAYAGLCIFNAVNYPFGGKPCAETPVCHKRISNAVNKQ
jgi:hypothetical protein